VSEHLAVPGFLVSSTSAYAAYGSAPPG
jgi:hypothetical protein